jgi:hypothetical protein
MVNILDERDTNGTNLLTDKEVPRFDSEEALGVARGYGLLYEVIHDGQRMLAAIQFLDPAIVNLRRLRQPRHLNCIHDLSGNSDSE